MRLYEANETMKMLGYQYPANLLCGDGVAVKDYRNLLDAHRRNGTNSLFEFGIDAFMLGYIYGMRSERSNQKRKKTIQTA